MLTCCGSLPTRFRRHCGSRTVEVEVGRQHLLLQRHDRDDRLDRARRAEQMAEERLQRADRHAVGRIAEHVADRRALANVVGDRRRAVRIDVADVGRRDAAARKRIAHRARLPLDVGCRHVSRVRRIAVADQLGENLGAAREGALTLLEDQHTRTFAEQAAVAVRIERPIGTARLFDGRQHAEVVPHAVVQRVEERVGAAADRRVDVAVADHAEAVADRVGRRRARRHHHLIGAGESKLERHTRRQRVVHDHRHGARAHALRAELCIPQHRLVDDIGRPDPASEHRRDLLRLVRPFADQSGLLQAPARSLRARSSANGPSCGYRAASGVPTAPRRRPRRRSAPCCPTRQSRAVARCRSGPPSGSTRPSARPCRSRSRVRSP